MNTNSGKIKLCVFISELTLVTWIKIVDIKKKKKIDVVNKHWAGRLIYYKKNNTCLISKM